MNRKENLRKQLSNSIVYENGNTFFHSDIGRLEKIFIKLAKGHIKYENSESVITKPAYCTIKPVSLIAQQEWDVFSEIKTQDFYQKLEVEQ